MADRARYEADRARDLALAGTHGIDEVMKSQSLDALVFPGSSGAAIAARPGYPTVIVPFGLVPNAPTPPLPEAFAAKPSPYGVSFTRPRVQRAAAPRARLRLRAGDEAPGTAARGSLSR